MPLEIERKFRVKNDGWRYGSTPVSIMQGYISDDPHRIVRARVKGDKGYITIKNMGNGISRLEFEYEIPSAEAAQMIELMSVTTPIVKTRHLLEVGTMLWEIDEFHGKYEGLIIAEIELAREDEIFFIPDWVGEEVTHDPRFLNSKLAEGLTPVEELLKTFVPVG